MPGNRPASQVPELRRKFFCFALLWFCIALPLSLCGFLFAFRPADITEVRIFNPLLSRGTTFASGVGIQILGSLALLSCVGHGWTLIADYYQGGWSQIRKYALQVWSACLVGLWVTLLFR